MESIRGHCPVNQQVGMSYMQTRLVSICETTDSAVLMNVHGRLDMLCRHMCAHCRKLQCLSQENPDTHLSKESACPWTCICYQSLKQANQAFKVQHESTSVSLWVDSLRPETSYALGKFQSNSRLAAVPEETFIEWMKDDDWLTSD